MKKNIHEPLLPAGMTLEELQERYGEMKMKERLAIPVQPMPEQAPELRAKNMGEVPIGYSETQAMIESMRCIDCKKPFCIDGCPVGINIPGFIRETAVGNFDKALDILKESNLLPAICGRVCPQEEQCQLRCTTGKSLRDVNKAVSIGRVERFLADYERMKGTTHTPDLAPPTGKKIAVIGSGPAGLTVAADLARFGHEVTIFEALHKMGGVLIYGIPEFRLPKEIVAREIDNLAKMGVKFRTDAVIGKLFTVDELLTTGYDAVFLGTGAGLPYFLDIPGEDLNGVYSANEYLTRANLMKSYNFPESDTPIAESKKVAVIGGGNVAMDSARTALRLGVDDVCLIYRRSREEMPARQEEIHHAEQEGVQFYLLQSPLRFIGDENGTLCGLEVMKMELGEPDESGRRRPEPIKGSEFIHKIDTAVVAIGNGPNPLATNATPGLALNKKGNIIAEEGSLKTSVKGVFAGGDIVLGAATVILAMGQGRKAAKAIDEYLKSGNW